MTATSVPTDRNKLMETKRLLGAGVSVTETAYSVGYSSLSHFSKVFRQHHGVTPKRWSLKTE